MKNTLRRHIKRKWNEVFFSSFFFGLGSAIAPKNYQTVCLMSGLITTMTKLPTRSPTTSSIILVPTKVRTNH